MHGGGRSRGHPAGTLTCHREKFAVRRCLAAGLANRQLHTIHFICWGRSHASKLEGGGLRRGRWRVLPLEADLLSAPARSLCIHRSVTVALAFAVTVDAADLWRLAFGKQAAGGGCFSDTEMFLSFVIYGVFKYGILFTVALIIPLI